MNRLHLLWCIPLVAATALVVLLYARKTNYGRESFVDWFARFGKAFNDWINNIRQANAKAVATVVIFLGTFVVWGIATLLELKIDPVIFPMWLAFVAGLGGFALATFKNERATDYGAMKIQADIERAKAGGAPTTVVNTPNAQVTGSPVSVEQPQPAAGG
jgi:hypothetical protein